MQSNDQLQLQSLTQSNPFPFSKLGLEACVEEGNMLETHALLYTALYSELLFYDPVGLDMEGREER